MRRVLECMAMSTLYLVVACLDELLVRTKKASMEGNHWPFTQVAHKPLRSLAKFGHFQGRGSDFAVHVRRHTDL